MLIRPSHIPSNESPYIKPTKFNQNQANNHGSPDSRILLDVPSETLTGITAYLDPPSLFSLARVHSRLALHVKDDNTWHRAFVCQLLGINPENEIRDDVKSLMLRRSENTWRNEFIARYRLRRRWDRSRNAAVTHIPVHSEISTMHMMPNAGLLASSVRYGIVSRSIPLNGKILPGYLDTSGLRLGLGVGNPNAEFAPDVSVCAISSDGGTARILWGFQHGEIGILTAPRTIDVVKRPVSEMARCGVDDEHAGVVLDVVWDDTSTVVASAGADGTVKLWDAKTVGCLWTSPQVGSSDACLKVAVSVAQGLVVTVTRSGEIVVWMGLQFKDAFSFISVKETRIPCPVIPPDSAREPAAHAASLLRVDAHSAMITILVAFEDDPYFYRITITQDGAIETTTFGDAAFGPLSSIAPFFSSSDPSFILTGDRIGSVSVYQWSAPFSSTPIHCVRKFEAFEDGAHVAALAWNGVVLITGSDRGVSSVWDGLTFEYLRSFPIPRIRTRGHHSQEKERVRQIILGPEKDVLLVNVGDKVLAWHAGPVPRNGPGGVRGRASGSSPKKKKDKSGVAKYLQQLELHQTISESKSLLKMESEEVQRAYGREREQRARLETMGLDEAEAVEYLLMLSRDEAQRHQGTGAFIEEGVFENFDIDDISSSLSHGFASSSASYTPRVNSHSGTNTPKNTLPIPRVVHSDSNEKIRVSPPFRAEPMEAGWGEYSPKQSALQSPPSSDEAHFPPMSTSASSSSPVISRAWSASSKISRTSSNGSRDSVSGRSALGSPESVRSSAWGIPRQNPGVARGSSSVSVSSSVRSDRSMGLNLNKENEDEMDDELKFALELSLAEARSRGENV